jgi:hypothetical protein
MIQVMLMDSEDKEVDGSEGHSNGGGDRKALELSMRNLQWKLNMFFLLLCSSCWIWNHVLCCIEVGHQHVRFGMLCFILARRMCEE